MLKMLFSLDCAADLVDTVLQANMLSSKLFYAPCSYVDSWWFSMRETLWFFCISCWVVSYVGNIQPCQSSL